MDKASFVAEVRRERQAFEGLLEGLAGNSLTAPILTGGWSVRDVVAHVSWYDAQMVVMLHSRGREGSELWELPTDSRNEAILEERRTWPLEGVLQDARRVFAELLEALEAMPEGDLTDPSWLVFLPPGWQPWQLIASNTSVHYRDHLDDLRRALEASQGGDQR